MRRREITQQPFSPIIGLDANRGIDRESAAATWSSPTGTRPALYIRISALCSSGYLDGSERIILPEPQPLRTMPTDPARVRRNDPGDPQKCPVWQFHEVYSDDKVKQWAIEGCRSAGIGCLDCKQPVIEAVLAELKPIQQRTVEPESQPELVMDIIKQGNEAAREVARVTMDEVRQAMSLVYRKTAGPARMCHRPGDIC